MASDFMFLQQGKKKKKKHSFQSGQYFSIGNETVQPLWEAGQEWIAHS